MLNFSCVVFCFYDIVFMFLSFFIHFKILFSILFFHIVLSQHLFSFYLILNHFDTNFNSFITISEFSDTLLKFWGIDLSFGALSSIFLNIIFASWSRIPDTILVLFVFSKTETTYDLRRITIHDYKMSRLALVLYFFCKQRTLENKFYKHYFVISSKKYKQNLHQVYCYDGNVVLRTWSQKRDQNISKTFVFISHHTIQRTANNFSKKGKNASYGSQTVHILLLSW